MSDPVRCLECGELAGCEDQLTAAQARIAELEDGLDAQCKRYEADVTKWFDRAQELEAKLAQVTAERDEAYAIARGYQVVAETPAEVLALGDELASDVDAREYREGLRAALAEDSDWEFADEPSDSTESRK